MDINFEKEQRYLKARERVKDIKGFYTHVIVFCLVIPVVMFINFKYVPEYHWFWFPIFGWGIGIFFHWLGVFGFNKLGLGKNWEERKIKEFMNENKR